MTDFAAFEIDLNDIKQGELEEAINQYNSTYNASFKLKPVSGKLSLVNGEDSTEDVFATGSLREIAFFWEGMICGQLLGSPEHDLADGV